MPLHLSLWSWAYGQVLSKRLSNPLTLTPPPLQIPKPKKFPHSKIYFAANQVVNRAPKERELLLRLRREYKISGIYLQYAMNIFP